MRSVLAFATAAAFALGALTIAANAETNSSERMQKAPTKRMGDEGKLPATKEMGKQLPDMTGPRAGTSPATRHSGHAAGPKGPPKRMGDQGKLPATDNMTGRVPAMEGPGTGE
ncbi:MAG TPA: hypothetical protein VNR88_02115 [Hyphomicrobium sp.]|nr:hypothetical protein [Hyphomicrobium sp.]